MKRNIEIELLGVKYPMCCSLGAVEEIETRFGSITKFAETFKNDVSVSAILDALKILIKFGIMRAKQQGAEDVPDFDFDEMKNLLDLSELGDISKKIMETVSISYGNEIKAVSKSKKKAAE